MEWMISAAQLLLSLSFLVAVHEFGHLIAAKYFGMRVEQFSIGFPPKLWSFKKGETEYALSLIPLGGYVKISGMIDESLDTETMKQPPQPWEFRSKPAWQRLIVMLGGIFVNVVVGILIFIALTFVYGDSNILKDEINNNGGFHVGSLGEKIGLKTGDKITEINGKNYQYYEDLLEPELLLSENPTYTVDRNGQILKIEIPGTFIQDLSKKDNAGNFLYYRFEPVVDEVVKNTAADRMQLQEGDKILEVNGNPVGYHDQIAANVKSRKDSIALRVQRGNEQLALKASLNGDSTIGFRSRKPTEFLERAETTTTYGLIESIPLGTKRAFTTLTVQIKAFGKVISGALSPKDSIAGPIGIAQAFGVEWDWGRFWTLTGVLSLMLAFMNLLPIPALDGGHVMFLSYEIISRRKPTDKFLETAQKIGMVFLLVFMIFIFANDISKLIPDTWW